MSSHITLPAEREVDSSWFQVHVLAALPLAAWPGVEGSLLLEHFKYTNARWKFCKPSKSPLCDSPRAG